MVQICAADFGKYLWKICDLCSQKKSTFFYATFSLIFMICACRKNSTFFCTQFITCSLTELIVRREKSTFSYSLQPVLTKKSGCTPENKTIFSYKFTFFHTGTVCKPEIRHKSSICGIKKVLSEKSIFRKSTFKLNSAQKVRISHKFATTFGKKFLQKWYFCRKNTNF